MKKLLPLLVCLLVVGCGEEVTQEAVVATTEEPARPTEAEAERLLETAIDWNSLVLAAQGKNQQAALRDPDYTGWVKKTFTNGQKKSLGFLRDGVSNGPIIEWHENGQRSKERFFKDGGPHGLSIEWHSNGKKKREANFLDGVLHGYIAQWYDSGQKKAEGTAKNDEVVSAKYWNRKGEEVKSYPKWDE